MKGRIIETDDLATGSPYVLCVVEGCPRAFPAGQDQMCGLARLMGIGNAPMVDECGALATVDLWDERGLLHP